MMNDQAVKQPKLQFRLRSLLYIMAVLALLLTVGLKTYHWYYAVPMVPLADLVTSFNSQYMDDPVGQYEPRITEAEIVASIRAQLPSLTASSEVKAIYSEIARTRQLRYDASLDAMPGWEVKGGTHYTVWWINLAIPLGKNHGYGLRIRENNHPVAKSKNEVVLDRKNLSWVVGESN